MTNLGELDSALLFATNKTAYDQAMQHGAKYVNSWKLRFWRAERFHTGRAAERIIRHFETKNQIFGEEALGRDLTWNDL